MANEQQGKPDPKIVARFFQRSAARLERLLIIDAPLVVVQREIQIARNRLAELESASGVKGRCPARWMALQCEQQEGHDGDHSFHSRNPAGVEGRKP